jgi:hypothetical protein
MEQDASLSSLKNRQTEDWEKWANSWKLLIDCSRPSRGDIKLFGKLTNEYISDIVKPTIVILGSTPELRELCTAFAAEYDATVTCVELLDYMYEAMTSLMFKQNEKEEVIFSNWLSIDLPDKCADIIIGDLTEGNITAEFKEKYYLEMNRLLKDGGKYITRATAYIPVDTAKPMITMDQIIEKLDKYKQKTLTGELPIQGAACHFGGEMIWDSWYKSGTETLSMVAYKDEISVLDEKFTNGLESKLMEAFHIIWDSVMNKYWDFYSLEKTLDLYKKYFTNVSHYCADDYPVAKNNPIFIMTKK